MEGAVFRASSDQTTDPKGLLRALELEERLAMVLVACLGRLVHPDHVAREVRERRTLRG